MADFTDQYKARLADLAAGRDAIKASSAPFRQKYEDDHRAHTASQEAIWANVQVIEAGLSDIEAEHTALAQMLSTRNVKLGG